MTALSTMKEKLAAIADRPGVIDPLHINVWTEQEGEPVAAPGQQVEIKFHRADGKKQRRRARG